jgi:hypothetical protein
MIACPKCGKQLPDWITDGVDFNADTLAQQCASHNDCAYVECDRPDCRALRAPSALDEWKAAAEHWRTHRWLAGCSHGN